MAAPRGGLIPCPRWRTETCEFPLTVPNLGLSVNRIADLWPTAYRAALDRLNLADNALEGLRPPAGLDFSGNAVADLSALGRL